MKQTTPSKICLQNYIERCDATSLRLGFGLEAEIKSILISSGTTTPLMISPLASLKLFFSQV